MLQDLKGRYKSNMFVDHRFGEHSGDRCKGRMPKTLIVQNKVRFVIIG